MRTLARSAITFAALLAAAPTAAIAAAQITGSPQEVSIKAQNSSIEEILSALSREFHIQYHSTANLEKHLTGTYQGSLQRVLTRILEGHNFIVKASNGQIDVTVFGTQGVPGKAVAAATPAASKPAPIAAKVAPTVEAQSPLPSTKPPASSPDKAASSAIKVAEGTMTKLMPGPSSAGAPVASPSTGSGPALSPAKGDPLTPPVAGPPAGPGSAGASPAPTPAPSGTGPPLGSASAGGSPPPAPVSPTRTPLR